MKKVFFVTSLLLAASAFAAPPSQLKAPIVADGLALFQTIYQEVLPQARNLLAEKQSLEGQAGIKQAQLDATEKAAKEAIALCHQLTTALAVQKCIDKELLNEGVEYNRLTQELYDIERKQRQIDRDLKSAFRNAFDYKYQAQIAGLGERFGEIAEGASLLNHYRYWKYLEPGSDEYWGSQSVGPNYFCSNPQALAPGEQLDPVYLAFANLDDVEPVFENNKHFLYITGAVYLQEGHTIKKNCRFSKAEVLGLSKNIPECRGLNVLVRVLKSANFTSADASALNEMLGLYEQVGLGHAKDVGTCLTYGIEDIQCI